MRTFSTDTGTPLAKTFTIEDCKTNSPRREEDVKGRLAIGEGESALLKLAERRKSIWREERSLTVDRRIVKENADIILDTPLLRDAVIKAPYLLIECCFSLVNKSKEDCPFFLNRVQMDFISKLKKHGSSRPYFILKGRQQGFTTLITAIQLSYAIVRKNFSGFTVADRDDNVKSIFLDKAKMMYSRLPKRLKPTEKLNSANELYFDKLGSSLRVSCASENIGRSRTLSFIHYSEVSFFKCSLASLQKSIQETLVPDAICVYETTANGFGDAKDLWDSGYCVNLFYPWWLTEEYSIENISCEGDDTWLKCRLEYLRNKGLNSSQLAWYAKKYKGYIDKSAIRQEYPCSAEEAFVACGDSIFDVEAISDLLSQEEIPYVLGYFDYKKVNTPVLDAHGKILYFNTEITSVNFVKSDTGYVKIVKEPYIVKENGYIRAKPYVIGADTSGNGKDYFAAKVIDNTNGLCVATLHKQIMDEDLFSEQLYCLGKYYNDALIAVETNYSRHPVRVLRGLAYPSLYSASSEEYTGFLTTSVTRPLIIANLVTQMRENLSLETDRDTLLEMVNFIRHPSGKPQAAEGKHDDLVMASAIARYVALTYPSCERMEAVKGNILKSSFSLNEAESENTFMEW